MNTKSMWKALLLTASLSTIFSAKGWSNIACNFDLPPDGLTASNLFPKSPDIPLFSGALGTTDDIKFGTGALYIGRNQYGAAAASFPIKKDGFEGMASEIGKMTLMIWVKVPKPNTSFGILQRRPSEAGPGYWTFSATGYHTLYFRMVTQAEGYECQSIKIEEFQADTWIHLAMTFDEGMVSFYVNGKEIGKPRTFEETTIPACSIDSTVFSICRDSIDGTAIDDVICLFDRVLNADEIYALYEHGLNNSSEVLR